MVSSSQYDITVIGGGLIGLATAKTLLEQYPNIRVCVLEKHQEICSQQSGHNSGVIHSGIYYKPGSFKAEFCVKGRAQMVRFCEENGIPTIICGKLIVATKREELPRLDNLYARGQANQVEGIEMVSPERIKEIEPHVSAIKAIWAPNTGIVDFKKVAKVYAKHITDKGGNIFLNTPVNTVITKGNAMVITTSVDTISTKWVINCAGLQADIVAETMGEKPDLRIIPFRGEYYILKKERQHLVQGLIYPVPDPDFPFLGVHFTPTMKGVTEAGPNAVLALKREGYRKTDISIKDLLSTITYKGFWKLARSNWKTGLWEINRSFRKSVFVQSLQALIPEIQSDDVQPGGTGVRAQAVAPDGSLIDDFRIHETKNAIHVLNAPSPGATSSLVIGKYIADIAGSNFSLNN